MTSTEPRWDVVLPLPDGVDKVARHPSPGNGPVTVVRFRCFLCLQFCLGFYDNTGDVPYIETVQEEKYPVCDACMLNALPAGTSH